MQKEVLRQNLRQNCTSHYLQFYIDIGDGQIISVKIQKKCICAEADRFNNFKVELVQMISVKIQKRYAKFMCRR